MDKTRRMSDLVIDKKIKDGKLNKSVKNIARPKLSQRPQQLELLTPEIIDVPAKDDSDLMLFAPFRLNSKSKRETIKYKIGESDITVSGDLEMGMSTIHDYDIVIYCLSQLNYEMEKVRSEWKKGLDSYLPPRTLDVNVTDLLKFLGKDLGGNQYDLVVKSLRRLAGTRVSIEKVNDSGGRGEDNFALISSSNITEREKGKAIKISIELPKWMHEGIVQPDKPSLLTLHPEYFLIKKGYTKWLVRLARKMAGTSSWEIKFFELYERSGVDREYKKFKFDLKKIFENSVTVKLPDYDFKCFKKRGEDWVLMTRRK